MQVTDEMVEIAARAMCIDGGFDPDERMPNDGPRWRYYTPGARAALTAALSDKQAVEVKALDWNRRNADGTIHIASALPGEYWAWELAGYGYWSWGSLTGREVPGGLDAAKAAAQHDYAARIRFALVDVPAVEPVAWREIEGYQGLYEVSSGGDVRSIQTGRLLAKNLAGSGYVKADLWKNGKRWQTTVHRLVADAFLEKQGSEINHINGIKTDNRVENLEWCSRSENVSHSFYVLSKRVRPVEAYNPGTGEKRHYRSVCEAARDGFKSSQIYRALKNHNRTVKGFHWQEASPPLSREGEDSAEVERLTRPIVGIEYRTAQEVFDIMADRIRLAATRSGSATDLKGGAE